MIEALAFVITGLSVAASIIYYSTVLRNTEKTRKAQLISRLREMLWASEESVVNSFELLEMDWIDFDDFDRKYDSTNNKENSAQRFKIWGLYQEMGYYLHENILDVGTVYSLIGGHNILLMWEKFKPIIYYQRKKYKDPSWFKYFEYMGEETRKYRTKQGISSELTDADEYLINR
jgi:hypothetical protein